MSNKTDTQSSSGWTRLTSVIDRFRSSLFDRSREAASTSEPETTTEPTGPSATNEGALTDREVVLGLLRERNGRVKQSTIVASTEWSASKVSRRLSRMEDRGSIERIRIGREKVVVDARREQE